MEEVLKEADVGYLAFNGPDGWPRITALNFFYDRRILWHGALAGERFECLKKDPRATFSAACLQLGRFKKITPEDPLYSKVLKATGVYALTVEEMSGKFKFAQNKSSEDRRRLAGILKKRGSALDSQLAEEILKTL
ncbi:MAG: flavin-nucleotide-binding protein [Deltaproteobacteria bacterium]|nr:flavin-nucleotide-binding protein [Deltaproteobacteria bacterium]